jgi:hypothetical protein
MKKKRKKKKGEERKNEVLKQEATNCKGQLNTNY